MKIAYRISKTAGLFSFNSRIIPNKQLHATHPTAASKLISVSIIVTVTVRIQINQFNLGISSMERKQS